jgi:tetratricopeptide (TPR) repeat protein
LYEKNYPKATAEFQQALQRSANQYREAACFLGSSLLQEGRYEEAAAANQKCVDMDPLDVVCLNNEAVALKLGGYAKQALPLLVSAVTLGAIEYGPGSLAVADYQANLGTILEDLGSYGGAEEMYGKALKVRQAKLGPNDPGVAELLNNREGRSRPGKTSPARRRIMRALSRFTRMRVGRRPIRPRARRTT